MRDCFQDIRRVVQLNRAPPEPLDWHCNEGESRPCLLGHPIKQFVVEDNSSSKANPGFLPTPLRQYQHCNRDSWLGTGLSSWRSIRKIWSAPCNNYINEYGDFLLRMVLPQFNGNMHNEDYLDWISEVEHFFDYIDIKLIRWNWWPSYSRESHQPVGIRPPWITPNSKNGLCENRTRWNIYYVNASCQLTTRACYS